MGWSVLKDSSAWKQDLESVKIKKLHCCILSVSSKARNNAHASEVIVELSPGICILVVFCQKTTASDTPFSVLDPSVYIVL